MSSIKQYEEEYPEIDLQSMDIFENGNPEQAKKAFRYVKRLAESGVPLAQCTLATAYFKGRGTEQDYEKAFEWYLKAAEQGHADAQIELADLYESGRGGETRLQ